MAVTKAANRRAELTRQIKKDWAEFNKAKRKADDLLTKIWMGTYSWVEALVAEEGITIKAAQMRLAGMLKGGFHQIFWYYNCGSFVKKLRLDSRKIDRGGVTIAMQNWGGFKPSEQKKVQSILARGGKRYDVRSIISRSTTVQERKAERRARRLEKEGRLTKAAVKMALMAALTLAKRFYGDDALIGGIYTADDEVLVQTK